MTSEAWQICASGTPRSRQNCVVAKGHKTCVSESTPTCRVCDCRESFSEGSINRSSDCRWSNPEAQGWVSMRHEHKACAIACNPFC
eukprot:8965964-Pyramimonas_sp.AAC.1